MNRYGKGNGWKNKVLNHAMLPIETFPDILERHRRWRKHSKRIWWILEEHRKAPIKMMEMSLPKLYREFDFGFAPLYGVGVLDKDFMKSITYITTC